MIQPMQHLWAPWRMAFIKAPRPSGCFFCEAAAADPSDDATHLVLARGQHTLVILNRYPYNNGHLMIAPNAHLADLEDLPAETANEYAAVLARRAPGAAPLDQVATAYSHARFGRKGVSSEPFPRLWRSLGRGVVGLAAGRLKSKRGGRRAF